MLATQIRDVLFAPLEHFREGNSLKSGFLPVLSSLTSHLKTLEAQGVFIPIDNHFAQWVGYNLAHFEDGFPYGDFHNKNDFTNALDHSSIPSKEGKPTDVIERYLTPLAIHVFQTNQQAARTILRGYGKYTPLSFKEETFYDEKRITWMLSLERDLLREDNS